MIKKLFYIYLSLTVMVGINSLFTQESTKTGLGDLTNDSPTHGSLLGMKNTLRFSTGFDGGTYFRIGKSIAQLDGLKLVVSNASGSIDNIKKIKQGKADLGLVQMDILIKYAMKDKRIRKKVKLVLPLYEEEVHIVARKNIKTLDQLEDRMVSVGPKFSGTAATAKIILAQLSLDGEIRKVRSSAEKAKNALLGESKLDAYFIVAGSPIEILMNIDKDASDSIHLLGIEEDIYDSLLKLGLPYSYTTIKKSSYPWLTHDVNTLAVSSAIIASSKTSNADIAALVKTIVANRKQLRSKHIKWREFNPGLAKFYLTAYKKYFHKGALSAIKSL